MKTGKGIVRKNGIVIAIDGPAGAGKSTTARLAARDLGYVYLDTGAMYRAVGLKCLRDRVSPDDAASAAAAADGARIELVLEGGSQKTVLDGEDVSGLIRTEEVSDAASRVAAHPGVRTVLVARQQEIGAEGGIVVEGRDTTTVVFPDAELKVFLEAGVEARADRRMKDLAARGETVARADLVAQIQARDKRDRETQERTGPWPPPDAVRVDTTGLTIDEQVSRIVTLAGERGATG